MAIGPPQYADVRTPILAIYARRNSSAMLSGCGAVTDVALSDACRELWDWSLRRQGVAQLGGRERGDDGPANRHTVCLPVAPARCAPRSSRSSAGSAGDGRGALLWSSMRAFTVCQRKSDCSNTATVKVDRRSAGAGVSRTTAGEMWPGGESRLTRNRAASSWDRCAVHARVSVTENVRSAKPSLGPADDACRCDGGVLGHQARPTRATPVAVAAARSS